MRSLALLFSAAAALRPASRAALPRARRLRAAADGAAPSSVSGRVYDDGGAGGPVVRLFTKPGCDDWHAGEPPNAAKPPHAATHHFRALIPQVGKIIVTTVTR